MTRSAVTKRRKSVALALATGMCIVAAAVAMTGCQKSSSSTSALFKQENTADNLRSLVEAIVKAQESGDLPRAADLTESLVVDRGTLKKFFKDDVADAFAAAQAERLTHFPTTEAELANLIKRGNPARTQLNVHGATTEEIVDKKTPTAKEFSAMPDDFAAKLRPAVTFYELEFVQPGKETGLKYHMFLWDGSRWRMLGPGWR
jgi:hypothetical protein